MEKSRIGKEWGKEFMAQHAILRFEKHKGNPARPLEAHHERQKEQYASNPDIDTSRSKYNFHIVKPEGRYYHFIQSRIEQARCRTRKDSTRFVDTLITASRPKFQELVRDIKRGLIAKVVVYKLDRISRSILDFANMMELFQQYNVEFVSSTEKFDTSTPMGRAMLNICIVFVQIERETIQKRVTDAYYSRSQRGFKMGGKAPYGFRTEPIKMDGINTKKLVVNPDEAANIRLMFEMYAQPTTSYGDITRYFAEQGILFNGKELIRPTLAQMLRNPVYVQADLDVYEFFKSQGTIIVNDAADFTGTNGCYLYQGRDVKPSKKNDLKDQMLVLAPHEGIVPADIWLACRKKLMNNMKIQSARKATHTWLAGKIKCGNCGYALMSINNPVGKQYLRCTKRLDNKSCAGCGKIITSELDGRKQELVKQIAELTVEAISPEQVNQISGYLDTWDNVSFDDKRRVVDLMITTVAATGDSLNITWKI